MWCFCTRRRASFSSPRGRPRLRALLLLSPCLALLNHVLRPTTCDESVCVSSRLPPLGTPPQSWRCFEHCWHQSTQKMTSPPKRSANPEEMAWASGLQQNDQKVHRWMCKQFHHHTGGTGETLEERSAKEMHPRPPDSDQTTLKRHRVSVLSVWLRK